MFNFNFLKRKQDKFVMGTGAVPRFYDARDYSYDEVALGSAPLTEEDWLRGYDVEKELDFELPIKNQNSSSSCVGNGVAYYVGVLNLIETKKYTDVSAKSLYSQIYLPSGGAYIADAFKIVTKWGAVGENVVSSYENGKPPSESYMRNLSWKNERVDKYAKVLQAKEYRKINARDNMDLFAKAIRDNNGIVGGVLIGNNGSWRTNEPTPSTRENGHCIFYGKFGIDEKGKWISTPNSWGTGRGKDRLHPDGWQKLRQDYFNKLFQFDPITLVDKPNVMETTPKAQEILEKMEKKIIVEGEGAGKKGIVINGKLMNITKDRSAEACLYSLANNGVGITISSELYNQIYNIDNNF